MSGILTERRGPVLRVTLARPEARNALDDAMIDALGAAVADAGRDEGVRAVVLDAAGEAFCAGTDVAWMELAARGRGPDDLYRLGSVLEALRVCPRPVIARVQGAAVGAGAALIACADVAVCAEDAFFALPAVRLGTVPAVIGPYVIEAVGLRQAKRYLLTGERFGAAAALDLGLVHEVCAQGALDGVVAGITDKMLQGGPMAVRETKRLLASRGREAPSPGLLREAAAKSNEVRRSAEGREGLSAYMERRAPGWRT